MVESALRSPRLTALDHGERASDTRAARRTGPGWVYACIVGQLVFALLLLVPPLAPVRVVIRSAALGMSLAFWFIVPGRIQHWGAVRGLGVVVLIILTLATMNPLGGVPVSVMAHFAFHLAVIAPLFWVGRLTIPRGTLQRALLIIWGFHTAGSILGVLQVLFPGRFQPITMVAAEHQNVLIQLSSGEWMLRPSGLSGTPGGAGPQGLYAALFGSGIVLARPFRFARVLGIISIGLGLVCIYLSEVRAVLVSFVICIVVLTALLSTSGHGTRATTFALIVSITALAGFYFALDLGGQMMSNRVASLIASDPSSVYYANRGRMLELTFTDHLPKYPLGAGLGHWGMINTYFGSVDQEIGAEIQITGWVLDGGLPLLIAYPAAAIAGIIHCVRAARLPDHTEAMWASVVAAYAVGGLAMCFSYPLFMGSTGLEFWVIIALLMQEMPLRARRSPAFAG